MSDVCNFESGYAFSSDDYKDKGTPLVRISNIQDCLVSLDNCVYIEGDIDKRFIINNGDLLIAMSGATTGKMGVYQYDCPALLNQRVGNIKVNTSLLLQKYRDYFMQSQGDLILKLSYGGAQPNVSAKIISDLFIPIPSLNEQEKVVAEIEKWFGFIDEIENGKIELESHIKKTKSKILDLAISGKLVPQDPNDEPAIELLKRINPDFEPCDNSHYENLPQGWAVCRLEDVCQICDNQRQPINSTERQERKKRAQTLYPYYGATGQVDWIDDYMLDGTFILLGEDGAPFLEKFADKAYVVSGKIWVNNHAHILKPNCDITYLTYYLNRYDYSECVNGSTRLKLTQADMKNMTIVLPPIVEQHRIAGRIEKIFRMLDAITAEL